MTIFKGDIWLVNLDPTLGDEISKTRPAIVVSRDAIGVLALRAVVPITGWQDRFLGRDWLVRIDPDEQNKIEKASTADTLQVRSVSTNRFVRRLGRLRDIDVERSEGRT